MHLPSIYPSNSWPPLPHLSYLLVCIERAQRAPHRRVLHSICMQNHKDRPHTQENTHTHTHTQTHTHTHTQKSTHTDNAPHTPRPHCHNTHPPTPSGTLSPVRLRQDRLLADSGFCGTAGTLPVGPRLRVCVCVCVCV